MDICTPAQLEVDRVTHVDLERNVIRFVDGRVELDDRDEFQRHQVECGNPGEVVNGVRAAADEVFVLVSRNVPPFDGAGADRWIEKARSGLPYPSFVRPPLREQVSTCLACV